jgi:hypothetical protein
MTLVKLEKKVKLATKIMKTGSINRKKMKKRQWVVPNQPIVEL